jgi:DNA polymerase-1
MAGKPTLYIVDGYSFVFRAYHIMGDMTSPDGTPTGALYGFLNMLIALVQQKKPDYLVVALDYHGPTFREEIFPEYKANRDKTPEDLIDQLEMLRPILDALKIPWAEFEGYEADDVIGTLSKEYAKKEWDINIVTSDSDLMQLVDEHISVLRNVRGTSEMEEFDIAGVLGKFPVAEPINVVDYKALVGDSSDNIPGVRGVGKKTAETLLAEYPTFEEIYKNIDKIESASVRKKLEEGKELGALSKDLATIRTNLDLKFDIEKFHLHEIDKESATEWFKRLGFRRLADRIGVDLSDAKVSAEKREDRACPGLESLDCILVNDETTFKKLLKELKKAGEFAIDVETDSLDARTAKLVGIAVCYESGKAYYIPVGHMPETMELIPTGPVPKQLEIDFVLKEFEKLLTSEKLGKYIQHAKYEYLVFQNYEIEMKGITFDTMLASYLLDPDERHNLKDLARKHLNWEMTPISDLIGKGAKQKSMDIVEISDACPYACADAAACFELTRLFKPQIKEEGLEKLFYDIELPVEIILANMEKEGIRLDGDALDELSAELDELITKKEKEIFNVLPHEINLNSPIQLAELLFDEMKLPKVRARSTDAEVLGKLKEEYPVAGMILEYRTLAKLRSTYTEALKELIAEDGRVHTSYNQTITSTGRLSSSNPNLQNIPIRTEIGQKVRKAFIAKKQGWVLLSGDYSQIELRLLAHFTGDETLVNAFKQGEDIHRRTAMEVFEVGPDEVTREMRRQAKVINFGIVYGMTAHGLIDELHVSRAECQAYLDKFFDRYPKVKPWMSDLISCAREEGYVRTLFGRRKAYAELTSRNAMRRQAAERAAVNMPLQGTAADIVKVAMVAVDELLLERGFESKMLLQVHDELVFDVPKKESDDVTAIIGETMSGIVELKVPLVVNFKSGPNWLEMKDVGTYGA